MRRSPLVIFLWTLIGVGGVLILMLFAGWVGDLSTLGVWQ